MTSGRLRGLNAAEFCGNTEFSILQFIFSITKEVEQKVIQKKLIYYEQITRYVQKQIEIFFIPFNIKPALQCTYKYEAYNTIMFKLKNILKENNIFQCL